MICYCRVPQALVPFLIVGLSYFSFISGSYAETSNVKQRAQQQYLLANDAFERRDFSGVRKYLARALMFDESHIPSRRLRIRLYLLSEDYDNAHHYLNDLLADMPDDSFLYRQRARAFDAQGNKMLATKAYENAYAYAPSDKALLNELYDFYKNQGLLDKAKIIKQQLTNTAKTISPSTQAKD